MRKSNLLFWVILWLFAVGATAQTVKNPLSIVAEYNLKSDGTFEKGDVLSAFGNYFKWAEVKNLSLPQGYHIPTKEELVVISGLYPFDQTTQSPYPDLSWKIDKTGDETVTIFGKTMTLNAHYYGEGKYVCYALRFKGGDNRYLSAFRWEAIFTDDDTDKTKIKGLKVTCRLLGTEGLSVDVKDLAKQEYWDTGNAADVVRYFPAAGYGNYTDDGTVMDQNLRGRYWSCTPRNEQETGAWGFGFDADFVMVYPWVATSHYCLRCFKNETEEPDKPIPADATISMELSKTGVAMSMNMAGPQKIEVDFGDGKRKLIDLAATQGVIEGKSVGTEVKIYAADVTNFRASNQMIKVINFKDMEKLRTLELGFNKLTSLSLEAMPELEHLNVVSNRIAAIDLTKSPKLKYVSLSKNFNIASLDLSKSKALEQLYVATNSLTSLNLDNVPELRVLDVSGNTGIKSVDLSKIPLLEEYFGIKTSIAEIDITQNTRLRRLNVSSNASLKSVKFSSLSNLQSCYISKTVLPKAQLDAFLAALPDVNNLKVYANERIWKKQLEVAEIPDVKAGTVELKGARDKGWKIDVLDEAWSVTPKNPCLVLTTAIAVGKDITLKVDNFYDPFWVDWGKWWSSFLQQKPYKIVHAVRQPEIKYYSRGLMTLDCSNQKITKMSLPNNDQTYAVNASGNELTEFVVSPVNSLVTIDLRNNKLSEESLNALYDSLRTLNDIAYPFETQQQKTFPQDENFGRIFVSGNPGAQKSKGYIAEQKGYRLDVVTDAEEVVADEAALCLYPNPAVGSVELRGVSPGDMIRIYTPSGTLVYKKEALCPTQNIDITSLTSGVYIVRVGNAAVKLVVK